MADIKIHPSWLKQLKSEFETDRMKKLKQFLDSEYKKGKEIYPAKSDYFRALNLTPLDEVEGSQDRLNAIQQASSQVH